MTAVEWLGTDVSFGLDLVTGPGGDLELVSGEKCVVQDVRLRLLTPKGGLWSHPDFGVDIYDLLHAENTPVNRIDLESRLVEAVENDPRVEVGSASAQVLDWDARRIRVRVSFRPVGAVTPAVLVLGYGVHEITAEVVQGA